MTDDDDLFAPRPLAKPVAQPEPKTAPICQPALPPRRTRNFPKSAPKYAENMSVHPVASLACRCGAREEVKEPCPDALDCWQCHGLETMRRYVPRYAPPSQAGRRLTALELAGMKLDGDDTP